ncbi:hypothetical protein QEO94_10275 [Kingella negevensis]|uniref:hypothetical protein n=1 Tax=Kingella negevensis TaxID=1522312 RepID=UPI0025432178|nr:hypothetical protein [Kingella negevensis]WII92997.1 hypothetical protein QEO94_10275 [Kingella negevensis]
MDNTLTASALCDQINHVLQPIQSGQRKRELWWRYNPLFQMAFKNKNLKEINKILEELKEQVKKGVSHG